MFEKYRTTGAMVALGRFTVDDVARASGVKPATVRGVLASWKDRGYVEEVGRKAARGPGRQYIEYQVRNGGADLDMWLRTVVDLRDLAAAPAPGEPSDDDDLPVSLYAAEDLLYNHLHEAAPDRREELADMARLDLGMALRALEEGAGTEDLSRLAARVEAADVLVRKAGVTGVLASGPPADEELDRVLLALDRVGDADIRDRLFKSLGPPPVPVVDAIVSEPDPVTGWVEEILAKAKGKLGFRTFRQMVGKQLSTLYELSPWLDRDYVVMTMKAEHGKVDKSAEVMIESCPTDFCVVADRYEPTLYNFVNSRHGKFLPKEGLQLDGLLGAITPHHRKV